LSLFIKRTDGDVDFIEVEVDVMDGAKALMDCNIAVRRRHVTAFIFSVNLYGKLLKPGSQ